MDNAETLNESLEGLSKGELAKKFIFECKRVAYLFEEMGFIVHPLANEMIEWEGINENHIAENNKLSVSQKKDLIIERIKQMEIIIRTYDNAKKLDRINKKAVTNVINSKRGVNHYLKEINEEVIEENWFKGYKSKLPNEFTLMKDAYNAFIDKCVSFYKSIEKDDIRHPAIYDYKKELILPKYESKEIIPNSASNENSLNKAYSPGGNMIGSSEILESIKPKLGLGYESPKNDKLTKSELNETMKELLVSASLNENASQREMLNLFSEMDSLTNAFDNKVEKIKAVLGVYRTSYIWPISRTLSNAGNKTIDAFDKDRLERATDFLKGTDILIKEVSAFLDDIKKSAKPLADELISKKVLDKFSQFSKNKLNESSLNESSGGPKPDESKPYGLLDAIDRVNTPNGHCNIIYRVLFVTPKGRIELEKRIKWDFSKEAMDAIHRDYSPKCPLWHRDLEGNYKPYSPPRSNS